MSLAWAWHCCRDLDVRCLVGSTCVRCTHLQHFLVQPFINMHWSSHGTNTMHSHLTCETTRAHRATASGLPRRLSEQLEASRTDPLAFALCLLKLCAGSCEVPAFLFLLRASDDSSELLASSYSRLLRSCLELSAVPAKVGWPVLLTLTPYIYTYL